MASRAKVSMILRGRQFRRFRAQSDLSDQELGFDQTDLDMMEKYCPESAAVDGEEAFPPNWKLKTGAMAISRSYWRRAIKELHERSQKDSAETAKTTETAKAAEAEKAENAAKSVTLPPPVPDEGGESTPQPAPSPVAASSKPDPQLSRGHDNSPFDNLDAVMGELGLTARTGQHQNLDSILGKIDVVPERRPSGGSPNDLLKSRSSGNRLADGFRHTVPDHTALEQRPQQHIKNLTKNESIFQWQAQVAHSKTFSPPRDSAAARSQLLGTMEPTPPPTTRCVNNDSTERGPTLRSRYRAQGQVLKEVTQAKQGESSRQQTHNSAEPKVPGQWLAEEEVDGPGSQTFDIRQLHAFYVAKRRAASNKTKH